MQQSFLHDSQSLCQNRAYLRQFGFEGKKGSHLHLKLIAKKTLLENILFCVISFFNVDHTSSWGCLVNYTWIILKEYLRWS